MKTLSHLTWFGLVISLFGLCSCRDIQIWLQSPIVTDWGNWGTPVICPDKTFVGAFQLKVEDDQRGKDDTGLNGVEFLCISMDGAEVAWRRGAEGENGIWRGRKNCGSGLATGFKLRSETDQRGGDDVGGVDMSLYCTNADGSKEELLGSGLHDWGSWTAEQHCPANTAVCGLNTQVEGDQGAGIGGGRKDAFYLEAHCPLKTQSIFFYITDDDTALNNVQVACCRLPPICDGCPIQRRYKRVFGCRQGLRDCTLKITTGMEKTSSTATTLSQSTTFYSKVGVSATAGVAGELFSASLTASAEWGKEVVNGRTIEQIVSTMSFESREVSLTLDCIGWAEELVLSRGIYELSTGEFRCTPFDDGRMGEGSIN